MKTISPILSAILFAMIISSCGGSSSDTEPNKVDVLTTGWTKTKLTTDGIRDIFFVQQTGYATTNMGIFKTTDGGASWNKVHAGSSFVNIGMGNTTTASFVTGIDMRIISTHDGGATFDTVTVADSRNISDVFYVNPTTAYAVGKHVWKTVNSGVNWTKVGNLTDNPNAYLSMHFISDQVGWMTRDASLMKTNNGGVTWTAVTVPGMNFSSTGNVFFVDANNGFASDQVSVSKTVDGGITWTKIFPTPATPSPGTSYIDLHFINAAVGYIAVGDIYKTTDGGVTWSKVVTFADDGIIEIHFTDATHGWAGSATGAIVKYAP
jgi:photosystem II stability/assembly factor-like uncharacterized protein